MKPQYFIGGPWHGRNLLKLAAHGERGTIHIATSNPPSITLLPLGEAKTATYYPREIIIMGEHFTVWVSEEHREEIEWTLVFTVNGLDGSVPVRISKGEAT